MFALPSWCVFEVPMVYGTCFVSAAFAPSVMELRLRSSKIKIRCCAVKPFLISVMVGLF